MKYFVVFLVVICLFSCNYNAQRNCTDYKTGTFKFNYVINGEDKTSTFKRTETYSVDYFEGNIDSASVRWINDCEFILKKLHPKSLADQDAIHMKILSTTDSSYTFEYKLAVKKLNTGYHVEKGTAYKIAD